MSDLIPAKICKITWDQFKATADPNVKFCDECKKNVTLVNSKAEVERLAREGECIAMTEATVNKIGTTFREAISKEDPCVALKQPKPSYTQSYDFQPTFRGRVVLREKKPLPKKPKKPDPKCQVCGGLDATCVCTA